MILAEEKIRKELLEYCYTTFIKNTGAVTTDGYVEKVFAFYSDILERVKRRMKYSEKRIDSHKILAGTTLSILMALQVKPHNYTTINNWESHPDVICINVDFVLFTIGYFFVSKDREDHKNLDISQL